MTNSHPYSELLKRRSKLTEQLIELVREMTTLEDQLKASTPPVVKEDRPFDKRSSRAIGEDIEKLAVKVVETRGGGPIATKAILLWMKFYAPKFRMPGQKPLSNLSAHLSNSSRFKRTDKGWILVGKGSPD